jgi:hypothetical protein
VLNLKPEVDIQFLAICVRKNLPFIETPMRLPIDIGIHGHQIKIIVFTSTAWVVCEQENKILRF